MPSQLGSYDLFLASQMLISGLAANKRLAIHPSVTYVTILSQSMANQLAIYCMPVKLLYMPNSCLLSLPRGSQLDFFFVGSQPLYLLRPCVQLAIASQILGEQLGSMHQGIQLTFVVSQTRNQHLMAIASSNWLRSVHSCHAYTHCHTTLSSNFQMLYSQIY